MKERRRWLPFLLLNIFVSAAVTGAILFWYDRTYRQNAIPAVMPAASITVTQSADADAAPLSPDEEIAVDIVSIVGAETLDAEIVLVRYSGEEELNLAGWHLEDEDKNTYIFPQLILYSQGAVQIHTIAGQDTVVDLYWGLRDSVWESGEEASLLDPQGNVRTTYIVP